MQQLLVAEVRRKTNQDVESHGQNCEGFILTSVPFETTHEKRFPNSESIYSPLPRQFVWPVKRVKCGKFLLHDTSQGVSFSLCDNPGVGKGFASLVLVQEREWGQEHYPLRWLPR